MITVERSIQVDRPQETVWAYSSDPARFPEWCGNIASVQMTSKGSLGVGTTLVIAEKFMGRVLNSDVQITTWEPGRVLSYKTTSGTVPHQYFQTLEAMCDGTRVTIRVDAEPEGFLKLAQGMVKRELGGQIEADLNRLQATLEG